MGGLTAHGEDGTTSGEVQHAASRGRDVRDVGLEGSDVRLSGEGSGLADNTVDEWFIKDEFHRTRERHDGGGMSASQVLLERVDVELSDDRRVRLPCGARCDTGALCTGDNTAWNTGGTGRGSNHLTVGNVTRLSKATARCQCRADRCA